MKLGEHIKEVWEINKNTETSFLAAELFFRGLLDLFLFSFLSLTVRTPISIRFSCVSNKIN
jgi:hypothetical protein